jgi:tryptophan 2,3-dioxygenase
LEFALGGKRMGPLQQFAADSAERARLEQRFHAPTLWDSFVGYLTRRGFAVPDDVVKRDVTQPIVPSPGLQAIFVRVYREEPALAEFCERLVDLDEGVQEWRYRHVKMVERTIGAKMGTAGSSGAEYLRNTLMRPAFPDLWAIRTEF